MSTKGFHRTQNILRSVFPYHQKEIFLQSKEVTSKWSRAVGCWNIAESKLYLKAFFNSMKPLAFINYPVLKNQQFHQPLKTIIKFDTSKVLLVNGRFGEFGKCMHIIIAAKSQRSNQSYETCNYRLH